jgi:hypothetical protein
MSIRKKLVSAAVTVPMAATVVFAGTHHANAVDAGQVIAIVKGAYEAFKMLTETHELTVDEATTRIIDAVNAVKTDTISHIDRIAAAEVQACARSAVIDFEDIRVFSPDNQQAFARAATDCVSLATSYIAGVDDRAAVDQLGFAVNVVGPIALLARSYVGLSTNTLKNTLITANDSVVSKLDPSCSTRTEPYFDEDGKPVPALADNFLTCTAYNGDQGHDYVMGRRPPGGFDYSVAREQAVRGISYPVAIASRSVLNS